MFEENKVVMIACGTQHVVALTTAGPDAQMPTLAVAEKVAVKEPEAPLIKIDAVIEVAAVPQDSGKVSIGVKRTFDEIVKNS